jgi:hypothetical protein
MKEIKLTRGFTAVVSDEDFELVNAYKWHAFVGKSNVYAKRTSIIDHTDIWMHHFILGVTDKHTKVDHEDHNGLNNQRRNLRIATNQQNLFNQRVSSSNTSGYKGVCWKKDRCRWVAMIRLNGKLIHLGYFVVIEEAAKAYDAASLKYFGKFAFTNAMAQKEKTQKCLI